MRVLIDTNIFIYSEGNEIIRSDVAELNSLSLKHNIELIIHPASLEDFKRDKNSKRRASNLSKIRKYPILNDVDLPDKTFNNIVGEAKTPQDIVDNKILYAVYKNSVNSLVTEDIRVHKKARKLGLIDRVLTTSQMIEYLKKLFERYIPSHFILEHLEIHNLNLQSSFFDSLRQDYPGFDDWFIDNSRQGRKCWCWRDDKKELKALLIYAEKNKPVLRKKSENVFKICTFKVADNVRGLKIGELLLRMCFNYCFKNKLTTAYLTTYNKHTGLRILLEDFGFENFGKKHTGELIYAKDFIPPNFLNKLHPLDYCKKFFPYFYDSDEVQKFIVPILPRYHNRLFADSRQRQIILDEYTKVNPEQNTIKKAYICKSQIKKIKPGDILLIYRSHFYQGITSIGVVESTLRHPKSFDEFISFVGPRSVYSKIELKRYYEDSPKPLAILFRYLGQLPDIVKKEKLIQYGVLKGPPQSIKSVDNISYKKFKEGIKNWLT